MVSLVFKSSQIHTYKVGKNINGDKWFKFSLLKLIPIVYLYEQKLLGHDGHISYIYWVVCALFFILLYMVIGIPDILQTFVYEIDRLYFQSYFHGAINFLIPLHLA